MLVLVYNVFDIRTLILWRFIEIKVRYVIEITCSNLVARKLYRNTYKKKKGSSTMCNGHKSFWIYYIFWLPICAWVMGILICDYDPLTIAYQFFDFQVKLYISLSLFLLYLSLIFKAWLELEIFSNINHQISRKLKILYFIVCIVILLYTIIGVMPFNVSLQQSIHSVYSI